MKKVIILVLGLTLAGQTFGLAQGETPPVPVSLGLLEPSAAILETLDVTLPQETVPGTSFQIQARLFNPTNAPLTLQFHGPAKTLYQTTEEKPVSGPYRLTLEPQGRALLKISTVWTQGDRPPAPAQGALAPLAAHLWNHYQRGPLVHRYLFQFLDLKQFSQVGNTTLRLQKLPGGWALGTPDLQEFPGIPPGDWDFILGLPGDYSVLGFTAAPGYGFNTTTQTSQALFLGTLDLALGPMSLGAGIEGRSSSSLAWMGLVKLMFPLEPRRINPLDADWDLRLGGGLWIEAQPQGRRGFRGLLGGRWRSLPLEFSWDWSWDAQGQNPQQGFQVYLAWGF